MYSVDKIWGQFIMVIPLISYLMRTIHPKIDKNQHSLGLDGNGKNDWKNHYGKSTFNSKFAEGSDEGDLGM